MDYLRAVLAAPWQVQLVAVAWGVVLGGLGAWLVWRGWRGDRQGAVRRCPVCDTPMVGAGLACGACRYEARRARELYHVRRDWGALWTGVAVVNLGVPVLLTHALAGVEWLAERGMSGLLLAVVGSLFLIAWRGRRATWRRCPRCRYDMAQVHGLRCPECGHEVDSEGVFYRRRRRRWAPVAGGLLVLVGLAATPGLAWAGLAGAGLVVAWAIVVFAAPTRDRCRWGPLARRVGVAALLGVVGW